MADPISSGTATAISAGGDVVSTGLNALFTGMTNRRQRKWSESMYDKQYNDNINFWKMQNEYNSPQAQMQRFEQAGLNRNLIYGQGNSGNAGSISTPDVQPVQYRSPDFSGVGNAASKIGLYQDYQIKQAQLDGMKLDNESRAIRNVTAGFQQQMTGIDYNEKVWRNENKLYETQADKLRADLDQVRQNTKYTGDENQRKKDMHSGNLQQQVQTRLLTMQQNAKTQAEVDQIRQAIKNLKLDESIKEREDKMRALGWTPGSPGWTGVIAQLINLLMGGK